MKSKIKLLIAMLFISITTMAQSPNMINYQGVARNTNGSAIANQNIKVRLKVHQGTATGTVKYSEVRSLTTDASGLFTIQIGSAGALTITGTWGAIKWETGAKFLQVEMDATGGNNFIDMGTQQLLSVPYAQYANLAGGLKLPYNAVDSTIFAPLIITNMNSAQTAAAINGGGNGGAGVMGSSQTSNGVHGTSNGPFGNGVYGSANAANAIGVYGNSNDGTGLKGYSNGGTGIFGSVLSGTALKGFSYSGYGLDINGKVKIAGGNTSPGVGKVLTSDASGNATWQTPTAEPKVAFRVNGETSLNFVHNVFTKADYQTEQYDLGNNFQAYTGSSTGSSSVFTAPVNGVYHFSAGNHFNMSSTTNSFRSARIQLIKVSNNTPQLIAQREGSIFNSISYCDADMQIDTDVYLVAGEKVYVELKQYNASSATFQVYSYSGQNYFSGHLVTTY